MTDKKDAIVELLYKWSWDRVPELIEFTKLISRAIKQK